jgi:hypothetical protein
MRMTRVFSGEIVLFLHNSYPHAVNFISYLTMKLHKAILVPA